MTYTSRVRQSHALSETESGLVESLLETLNGNNESDEYAMYSGFSWGLARKKDARLPEAQKFRISWGDEQ